ncbi:hypothetical protein Bca52824_035266 [Brassica carinata]|uniref:DUF4283 domain-containing protein n=1 Tax=Brassica carinata TaxID=52824 RepID=A0A8X7S7A3_BRACI|nr:hypothetical protein Bca52824_035266 [Brassica carinata]
MTNSSPSDYLLPDPPSASIPSPTAPVPPQTTDSTNTSAPNPTPPKQIFPPKRTSSGPPKSWAQRAKTSVDRSLKRLAPTSTSPDGKPRVSIPDEVFHRGAELHKEYLVGTFLGKMPYYGPIRSVLNFMWGKGVKLEIHIQPLKRAFLVRVPNKFIRTKALEKRLWYVGTSMFYVSQWGSSTSSVIPEIETIPLWAHLSGVPFDLRTKEGLSLAAGLVGEPIETDDYTKNLTDLNVAYVKVEADLTKPLRTSGELVRQNGEIIPIDIEYPWVPPSCTHCHRIGHLLNDCIYSAVSKETEPDKEQGNTSMVTVPDPPESETSDSVPTASFPETTVPPPDDDDVVPDPQDMSIDVPSLPPLYIPPPSSSHPLYPLTYPLLPPLLLLTLFSFPPLPLKPPLFLVSLPLMPPPLVPISLLNRLLPSTPLPSPFLLNLLSLLCLLFFLLPLKSQASPLPLFHPPFLSQPLLPP